MGLLFGFDLETMFDAPEKSVAVFQRACFAARQELQLCQDRQRFQRAGFLEKRMPRAVQELQRLHHKFNLANPARA